jgi:hypothetical protein
VRAQAGDKADNVKAAGTMKSRVNVLASRFASQLFETDLATKG